MKKLTVFSIALILVMGVISTAEADTIYFDDGTLYELQPGESVYISSGRVWEFTRFDPLNMRIEALEPLATEEPVESTEDCLGFGPGGCASSSDDMSESEKAYLIHQMVQKIANPEG